MDFFLRISTSLLATISFTLTCFTEPASTWLSSDSDASCDLTIYSARRFSFSKKNSYPIDESSFVSSFRVCRSNCCLAPKYVFDFRSFLLCSCAFSGSVRSAASNFGFIRWIDADYYLDTLCLLCRLFLFRFMWCFTNVSGY